MSPKVIKFFSLAPLTHQVSLGLYIYLLVGHSLDSDLKSLRLIHNRILDTAAMYPNVRGAPFKNSLKTLAADVLGLIVQDSAEDGHDSIQDAAVALELALHAVANAPSTANHVSPVDIAWSSGDSFVSPKSPLLSHSCMADLPGTRNIAAYACGPYADRPLTERFLIGYRKETDVCAVLAQDATPNNINVQ